MDQSNKVSISMYQNDLTSTRVPVYNRMWFVSIETPTKGTCYLRNDGVVCMSMQTGPLDINGGTYFPTKTLAMKALDNYNRIQKTGQLSEPIIVVENGTACLNKNTVAFLNKNEVANATQNQDDKNNTKETTDEAPPIP